MSKLISLLRTEAGLRNILIFDALTCIAMGVGLLAAANPLGDLLALDPLLLRGAGAVLLPFAAFVLWTASRRPIPAWAVWTIVVLNALWTLESLVGLAAGWLAPNTLGIAFVVAQAVAVGVIAELEMIAVRRPAPRNA